MKTAPAGKMTVPTRRSAELAELEKKLLENDPEGQKTSVIEVMTLVEAERRIAREASEAGQSGVRAITIAVPAHAIPASAPGPSPASVPPSKARSVAPVARPSLVPRSPAERRRQAVAAGVVTVVMVTAMAILGVALARKGWTVPGLADWERLLRWATRS